MSATHRLNIAFSADAIARVMAFIPSLGDIAPTVDVVARLNANARHRADGR